MKTSATLVTVITDNNSDQDQASALHEPEICSGVDQELEQDEQAIQENEQLPNIQVAENVETRQPNFSNVVPAPVIHNRNPTLEVIQGYEYKHKVPANNCSSNNNVAVNSGKGTVIETPSLSL